MHEGQHFMRYRGLLGRGQAAIRDHAFACERFIGLMKLQLGLIARANVLRTR